MSQERLLEKSIQPAIIIRTNKVKVLFMLILSILFIGAGIWLMQSSQNFTTGLIVALGFGIALLVFLFLLLTPALLLIVDEKGIHSYYPFWSPRTILWEEIACIRVVKASFNSSLSVDIAPDGKKAYLARNYPEGRVPGRLLKEELPTAFSILLTLSTTSGKRFKTRLQEHYAEQIQHSGIVL
jgi:hypothetical protein